jgi:hypothetical protein
MRRKRRINPGKVYGGFEESSGNRLNEAEARSEACTFVEPFLFVGLSALNKSAPVVVRH